MLTHHATFPLYIETAMGRMIVQGYQYPRNAARSRIWDVLRDNGWIATKITFDAQDRAWIARVFV
jgi:hypothetical protein